MKSFVIHTFLLIAYAAFAADCVAASKIRGSSTVSSSSELPGDEESNNVDAGFREHPKRGLKIIESMAPSPLPYKTEDGLLSRTGGYVNSKAPTATPTKAPTSSPTKLKLDNPFLKEPVQKQKLEKEIPQKLVLGDAIAMSLRQKEGIIKRKFNPPTARASRERGAKRTSVLGRHAADKLAKPKPIKTTNGVKTGTNKGVTVKNVGLIAQANPSIGGNRSFRGFQPQIEIPEAVIPEAETPVESISAESLSFVVEPEIPEPEIPEAEIPEVEIPEVEIPEVEIPEVETSSTEKLKNNKIKDR